MKKLFVCVLIIFFCLPIYSQPSFTVSDKEGAKEVLKNVLAVVLKEQNEKMVKKLSKDKNELNAYLKEIDSFNVLFRNTLEREWTLTKDIKFISKAEAEKYRDEKNSNYSILELESFANYKIGDFYSKEGFNSEQARAYHFMSADETQALQITNANSPKKIIALSYLPYVGVSAGSIDFMIRHLQYQIKDCLDKNMTKLSTLKQQVDKKSYLLKTKTLLLFDPLISNDLQKVIDKNELKKFYGYKYKVVDFDEADRLITEKNKDYAFIWIVPAGAQSGGRTVYNYFIIDAADAKPLYMTGKGVAGANGKFHSYHLSMVMKKIKS